MKALSAAKTGDVTSGPFLVTNGRSSSFEGGSAHRMAIHDIIRAIRDILHFSGMPPP